MASAAKCEEHAKLSTTVWEGVLWKTDFKRSDCVIKPRRRLKGAAEAAPPAKGGGGSVAKSMLASMMMGGAAYKTRYFVLDKHSFTLTYWKSESDAAKDRRKDGHLVDSPAFACGSLDLTTIVSAGRVERERASRLQPPRETMAIFELRAERRAYVFSCVNLIARKNWFDALMTVAPDITIDRQMREAAASAVANLAPNAECVQRAAMEILSRSGGRQSELVYVGALGKPNFKIYGDDKTSKLHGGKSNLAQAVKMMHKTKDRNSWTIRYFRIDASRRKLTYAVDKESSSTSGEIPLDPVIAIWVCEPAGPLFARGEKLKVRGEYVMGLPVLGGGLASGGAELLSKAVGVVGESSITVVDNCNKSKVGMKPKAARFFVPSYSGRPSQTFALITKSRLYPLCVIGRSSEPKRGARPSQESMLVRWIASLAKACRAPIVTNTRELAEVRTYDVRRCTRTSSFLCCVLSLSLTHTHTHTHLPHTHLPHTPPAAARSIHSRWRRRCRSDTTRVGLDGRESLRRDCRGGGTPRRAHCRARSGAPGRHLRRRSPPRRVRRGVRSRTLHHAPHPPDLPRRRRGRGRGRCGRVRRRRRSPCVLRLKTPPRPRNNRAIARRRPWFRSVV